MGESLSADPANCASTRGGVVLMVSAVILVTGESLGMSLDGESSRSGVTRQPSLGGGGVACVVKLVR